MKQGSRVCVIALISAQWFGYAACHEKTAKFWIYAIHHCVCIQTKQSRVL